ncbi:MULTISPECIES: fumarate hydratase [unclassified Adlercreutzia]|uniref:fumarate hydratase n=1 Tax=unclassified Adlercreutzia TaxID=2636013 RepID=UPI0013EB8064|nr:MULTISPECIES: fumarate hydratase [unclassified Adlercreutzia]
MGVSSSPNALNSSLVARAVYAAIRECASTLRPDVLEAIRASWLSSKDAGADSRQTSVLHAIIENALIAERDNVPICQDTGTVWVCLEVGEELSVPGGVFREVNDAVARAYEDGKLRMSVVRDALFDRSNTNNNTPAFCELRIVPGSGALLHVLLKGGGSDNASRVCMLSPDAGASGVAQVVINCVREKAANACPPLVVGVGVGATFDKVAGMSKHALLRPIGSPAQSDEAAAFESELLGTINACGIGPAALGGTPTALAVHLETAPCHIAALPVAVNMGCCAMRSATIDLMKADII